MFQVRSTAALRALVLAGAVILAGCGSPADKAQNHYQRAVDFIAKNDFVKARIELRNALQQKNDFLPAWQRTAELEERDRNWAALARVLRRISELEPSNTDVKLRLARLLLVGGSVEESLKVVNAVLEADPRNLTAMTVRSAILLRLNDNAGALQEAKRVLDVEKDNVDALVVVASEQARRNDLDGALKTLEGVRDDKRDDIGVVTFRLMIYDKKGDLPQIEAHLKKLIAMQPQEPRLKAQLVRFYIANKRADDAEAMLRAISEANPNAIQPKLDIASFLYGVKGADAARQQLQSYITAGGPTLPYQMALADIELQQGRPAAAIDILEGQLKTKATPEELRTVRLKLAEILTARRDFAKADTLVSEVLREDARNIGALRLRGAVRMEQGKLDDAIADLRRALNDQPRSEELMQLLATALERQGSIELADKQFFDAVKVSNFSARPGLSYVSFLRRRGDLARAEEILGELMSRNRSDLAVLSALADLRLARQNWVGAQEVAEAIRKLGDKTGIADQIQGLVLAGQQRFGESVVALESAQAASPDAAQPTFALVRGYILAKQPEKAEAFVQSLLKANPSNIQAWVLLGFIHSATNAPDRALQAFKTAVERDPKNPVGYRALADFYVSQKKLEDAEKTARDGLQQQPGNVSLRMVMAGLHEAKGNFDGAIQEYESLLKDQPGSLVVANNLASILSDQRSDKQSLDRAYSVALSLSKSQVPQFKDTLGWIHYLRGDHRAATPLLEEAAAALPNVAFVQYHLGMTYSARGETERAVERLQKALDLTQGRGELADKVRAQLKTMQQRG